MFKKIINKSLTFIVDVFFYAFLVSIINFILYKVGYFNELVSTITELIIGLLSATLNLIYKWSKSK